MPIIRMPDGAQVRFPDDMPREQIRSMIAKKFPELANGAKSASDSARGKSPMATLTDGDNAPGGLTAPGNLDLNARKVFNGPDGDFRTENSISIGTDQGEVLIPTVVDGKQLSEDEAIAHYERTGENLGAFDTPDNANGYAERLHQRQGEKYRPAGASPSRPVPPAIVNPQAEPEPRTGLVENIGAGIDEGANALLGAPVDLPVWVGNRLINATNSGLEMAGAGRPVPNIPEDLPGSSQGWEKTQEALGFTPPSDVVPADNGQRLARTASSTVTMASVPELAAMKVAEVASRLPAAGKAVADGLGTVFGNSKTGGQFARSMATNAAGGVGAQVAMDGVPDNLKPLVGLVGGITGAGVAHAITGIPGGLRTGLEVMKDYARPLTAAGREQVAGNTLREAATDPGAVRESLDAPRPEYVPGSKPTTFQQTGDMGLGALERAAATRNPDKFMQRRADQNAAQVAAVERLQPTGAPEAVSAALRSQLEDIDKRTFASLESATQNARKGLTEVGQGRSPEMTGESMRMQLEAARSLAKERETMLWAAVDPDGSLALSPAKTRATGERIVAETPASARQPAGEEAAIYGVLRQYGDTVPFSELSAMHTRIKDELRNMRVNGMGESTPYRRLTQLNSAVFDDLNEAVVVKAAQEQQAVAAGTMRVENTLEAVLQRQAEAFLADRRAAASGQNGGASIGNGGPRRPSTATRVSGAASQGQYGPGGAPRDPRLSGDGLSPNFDEGALDRLTTAREMTQERVNRFDNPTLKPIRQRPSTQSGYDMAAASVPGRLFHAGAKSFDDIQTFRQAVGDAQAMPALKGYAVDRLRVAALREDGTLDPVKVASWRRSHADALRAFPALDAKLKDAVRASETMAEVAVTRKLALDEAQKGILGRLLGIDDPQDVARTIGGIFSRQDRNAQMLHIVEAIGSNPEAKEGLRKAITDYMANRFIGNTEAGTSGIGTIRSDMLQSFVKDNRGALRIAGFEDDALEAMEALAKDMQQTNRSIASVKLPGGSNTAQDTFAIRGTDAPQTIMAKMAAASITSGGITSLALGPIVGVPVGVATALTAAMRQAGLQQIDDLIADAMLHPERAKYLLTKATPQNVKMAETVLGRMYRKAAEDQARKLRSAQVAASAMVSSAGGSE